MEKKRLTKYVWYGSDADENGNPILPDVASPENHLDGLNKGELYIHLANGITTLWTVSSEGKVVQVSGVSLDEIFKLFLRKDKDDETPFNLGVGKNLTVGESVVSEEFTQGELGNGFILKYDKNKGHSYFEVDEALIRKVAYFVELIIKKLSHVGGSFILSPASMRCDKVEEYEEYYRCYFLAEHEGKSINQEFRVNDQARSQTFNVAEGVSHNVGSQYYWRLVVGISDEPTAVDGQKYHYIDLSKIDCDEASLAPLVGDDIVQLGNRTDPTRQNAIILSTVGEDAPSIKQYEGIQFYTLAGKEKTVISPKGNVLVGDFLSKTGEDMLKYIDTLGARLDDVQNQTDKSYVLWFFDYEPTLDNYPASEWATDSVRKEHVQDMFYNEESGRAYRFLMPSEGVFVWIEITDHETIKALEKAAEAKEAADSKIQNFIEQPTPPYQKGDRWSNATYGDLFDNDDLVCVASKAEGENFDIADWQPTSGQDSAALKKIYSEFARVDNEIAARVTAEYVGGQITQSEMRVAEAVAGLYVKTDTFNSSIEALSGQISLKVSSDNIINSINLSPEAVTINASKINLNGQVTFSMLAEDAKDAINGKATQANIDASIAAYGNTIIEGGYIKTSLINADAFVAKNFMAIKGGYTYSLDANGFSIVNSESTVLSRFYVSETASALDMTKGDLYSAMYPAGFLAAKGSDRVSIIGSHIELSGNAVVKNFRLGNTSSTASTTTDFIRTGSSIVLPAPSSCFGKVIFTRTTAECTISSTGKNIYPRSGALTESFTRTNTAQFFISDGTYWYEFYCG